MWKSLNFFEFHNDLAFVLFKFGHDHNLIGFGGKACLRFEGEQNNNNLKIKISKWDFSLNKCCLIQIYDIYYENLLQFSERVTYNGHDMNEFVPQRTAGYINQYDVHIGL